MNLIFTNKETKLISKISWPILVLSGLTGIILMWIARFYYPISSITEFERIGTGANRDLSLMWTEQTMIIFYFTHVSSSVATILGVIMIFGFLGEDWQRRIKLISTANLILMLVLFWATLAIKTFPHSHNTSPFAVTSNMFVHVVTPVIGIIIFGIDSFLLRREDKKKITWKSAWKFVLFPLVWQVLALIIYFSLGMNHASAVYSFVDILGFDLGWYWSIAFMLLISLIYYGIVYLLMFLMNLKTKAE